MTVNRIFNYSFISAFLSCNDVSTFFTWDLFILFIAGSFMHNYFNNYNYTKQITVLCEATKQKYTKKRNSFYFISFDTKL